MLSFIAVLAAVGAVIYLLRQRESGEAPHATMTEERIKQGWRQLGFFCEVDDEQRAWRLTGSRAGLLYFPDLLLGYVNDPQNAADGERRHFGPYGSLEIMTYPDPGIDGHAIRGSLIHLTHLAELVSEKLAFAEPGSQIKIREEFAPESRYALLLDVRPDGFDPSSADRERLGATREQKADKPKPPAA